MYFKAFRVGFAAWAVLVAMTSIANAQAYSYVWDNGGGNNNWGNGTNWGIINLGFNNVTPSAFFEEMGLINNGTTANVTTSQTQLSGSAADNQVAAAGVNVDGITTTGTTGNGSTLNIASGGTLSILTTYGPNGALPSATPTAGTGNATLNNHGILTVQPGGTLSVQGNIAVSSGTFTATGGSITAGNLNEAGTTVVTPTGVVNLAVVNLSGSTTVNVANGTVLNGATTITGPSVVFNTPSISMANTSVFIPSITNNAVAGGTGHSVIGVTGSVSVNGALRPIFAAGVTPHLGDVWTLWDSAQIQGSFAVSDAAGTPTPLAGQPALATGLRYTLTTTKTGAVHGVKGQLTVENFLTAEVNRANGQITIRNTNTTAGTGVAITGYQIASPGNALKPTAFTSAFGGTWQTAGVTVNSISELNPSGNSNVGLGGSASLGSIYDPVSLESTFGTTPVADLTFSYSRSDGRTVNAPVSYINTGLANTLVLQVDPTDGKARIINDSIFNNVQFDGYQVTSASNSLLTTWHSLADQAITGWEEASPTTGSLGELNPTATTNVNAGQTAATMTGLFKTTGTQDLQFSFRVTRVKGDYNSDGLVNAADFAIWRDTVGSTGDLPANGDNTGASAGVIDAADFNIWKANFGKVNGTGLAAGGILTGVVRYVSFAGSGGGGVATSPVPEPASLVLLALGGLAMSIVRWRKCQVV